MDFEEAKRGIDLIKQGLDLLGKGPLDYYLKQLTMTYDAYIALSPFKVGDRVTLVAKPNTNNNWNSSKHFLVPGEPATIRSIGAFNGKREYDIEFDNESWVDKDGKVHPPINKHTYHFGESWLVALPDVKAEVPPKHVCGAVDYIYAITEKGCPECPACVAGRERWETSKNNQK